MTISVNIVLLAYYVGLYISPTVRPSSATCLLFSYHNIRYYVKPWFCVKIIF